jgi:hypothetical protein
MMLVCIVLCIERRAGREYVTRAALLQFQKESVRMDVQRSGDLNKDFDCG